MAENWFDVPRGPDGQWAKSRNMPVGHMAGLSYARYKTAMVRRGLTQAQLEAIYGDPNTPTMKKAAAAELLQAGQVKVDKIGRIDPEPGRTRQRIEERTFGKPAQPIEIEQHKSVSELGRELVECALLAPERMADAIAMLARQAPVFRTRLLERLHATREAITSLPEAVPEQPKSE